MRIDQFVAGFAKHDAISNHVLQLRQALRRAGYQSDIYGEWIDSRLPGEARPYQQGLQEADAERVLLYHASTHSPIAARLHDLAAAGQVMAIHYHNITPAKYFVRWEPPAAKSMVLARDELQLLAPCTRLGMAVSAYNETELIELGYRRTAVCPLLVDLEAYHVEPDGKALGRLRRQRERGGHRWLFVGRVTPNKCQHDIIASFALYRRLFDPHAALTLVGGATSPRYLRALQQMTQELDLGDSVEMRDVLPFSELLAYFRASDLFVCLSEHEGFCVPILESMELGLPVVAYRAAAVADTVAAAGILLDDKDPLTVACAVDDLLSDDRQRAGLVAAGRSRAAAFSLESTTRQILDTLGTWLSTVSAGA